MGQTVSVLQPSELPEAKTHAVLNGEVTLRKIAEQIKSQSIKNVVLMTGAGLSVESGIPDFRTPGSGLYDNLTRFNLPSPESLFEINYFRSNPAPFYTLLREMMPGKFHPSKSHFFSTLLQKKGLLLRHYTQNVDSLENLAGLAPEKLVAAHGSFSDAHCIDCGAQYPVGWLRDYILNSNAVPRCVRRIKDSLDLLESRKSDEIDCTKDVEEEEDISTLMQNLILDDVTKPVKQKDDNSCASEGDGLITILAPLGTGYCGGLIKPDIVFFGEALPNSFGRLSMTDLPSADLLIVIGTSLQVHPFAGLVCQVSPYCPRLLMNREAVGVYDEGEFASLGNGGFRFGLTDNYRDVLVLGNCDDSVMELCDLLGWREELLELRDKYFSCSSNEIDCKALEAVSIAGEESEKKGLVEVSTAGQNAWQLIEDAQPIDPSKFVNVGNYRAKQI